MRIERTRVAGLWLALVLVLGLGSAALAQTGAASITGLVTDQSGAATPGVTVTAMNQATQRRVHRRLEQRRQLHDHGASRRDLRREVRAQRLQDRRHASRSPLEAKQIARLDFRMEIGALEDVVEVTAPAPVLQTESATVGEVISGNTVQSLPAERAQRRPARAAAARDRHLQPARASPTSAA